MITTAILIDGAFFLKRYRKLYKGGINHEPKIVASNLYTICHKHLTSKKKPDHNEQQDLYRIFYYDCYPLEFKVHHPLTKKFIDFSKTKEYHFRKKIFKELKKKRKMALRLRQVVTYKNWKISSDCLKDLLKQDSFNFKEKDITLDIV